MAYDTLKAEIRQYIQTNGQQEITGQILQNVLLDMVNAYPSLDGYATQQWVQNQLSDMATMTWVGQNFVQNSALNNYLPLSGGTLTGFIGAGTLSTGSYSLGNTGLDFSYSSNGSPRYAHALRISSVDNTIAFYGRNMTLGTVIATGQITSNKFIVTNGTSSQFLKADGSLDSNTYLSSADLSGYATQTWVGNNYLPLTGGTLTGGITAGTLDTGSYSLGTGGLSFEYSSNGSTRYAHAIRISSVDNTITFYGRDMTLGTVIGTSQITSDKFIVTNGTSAQFLKADGSVDSNTYLTSSAISDMATMTWVGQQGFLTSVPSGYATETWVGNNYLPLTGGTLTGDLTINNSAKIVQTNQSYQPYLLFHKPNVNWSRLEMADDGTIEVREGEDGTAFHKFACGHITVDGGSDGYGSIYIDDDGINIIGSRTNENQVHLLANHIYCDGDTKINGDCEAYSFIQTSDIYRKSKISDLLLSVEDIAEAPLFKFTWKNGKDKNVHIGTSAQYWQDVTPELTSENKNGVLGLQYDVAALAGVITVAKCVVDHEQRIAELEKENALLKAKLNIN